MDFAYPDTLSESFTRPGLRRLITEVEVVIFMTSCSWRVFITQIAFLESFQSILSDFMWVDGELCNFEPGRLFRIPEYSVLAR